VAAYLFLLLSAVLYQRVLRWGRPADRVLLAVCAVLLVTSKPQHAVLGFWVALLFFACRRVLWPQRSAVFGVVAAAVALISAVFLRYGAPRQYQAIGGFTMVFYQVLPHARNPDQTLADLGLDSSYCRYTGKTAYSEGTGFDDPGIAAVYLQKLSYPRLAWFFVRHPRDAYVALQTSLSEAGRHRPELGNFDSAAGAKPWQESRAFSLWSSAKRAWFHHRGARFLLCFGLLAAAVGGMLAISRHTLPRGATAGGAALLGMAITEMLVASLADAIDIPRHHMLFYAQCDLLLLMLFYLVAKTRRAPHVR